MKRPNWIEYFLNITKVVSTRSSCLRRHIGAIAVKDKRILATGYNGAPSGVKHCLDRGGCLREKLNIPSGEQQQKCLAIHAEENLILQAAIHGISLYRCDIYCTNQPCNMCTRKIINLKPKNLYYIGEYPDKEAIELFEEVAIRQEKLVVSDYLPTVTHWKFFKE